MASKKRCHLSLKQKVEVNKSDPKLSVRALSELFHCGKTQISDILKDKEFITSLYESNASSSLSHTRHQTSDYSEINEALYKWYLLACSKNISSWDPANRKG